ncbi:MAG: hypothetical protein V3S64_16155 [bacterium]
MFLRSEITFISAGNRRGDISELVARSTSIWVLGMAHPDDPQRLKAGAIPRELAARFGH